MLNDIRKETRNQLANEDVVTVLACDGGGIRGAATASFLVELEKALNAAHKTTGKSLSSFFDLFVGTSTGGLISLGLGAKGMNAQDVAEIYSEENATSLFQKISWFIDAPINNCKYYGEPKEQLIKDTVDSTLKMSDVVRHCAVTAYDLESRSSQVLSSMKEEGGISPEDIKVWEAGNVTSAAPTYFPPAKCADRVMIDGGVVCNDPTMVGYALAKQNWPGKKIRVLSVGTVNSEQSVDDPDDWVSIRTGGLWWLTSGDIIGICMDPDIQQRIGKSVLGEDMVRINSKTDVTYIDPVSQQQKHVHVAGEMDDISASNIQALKEMGQAWWINNRKIVADLLEFSLSDVH